MSLVDNPIDISKLSNQKLYFAETLQERAKRLIIRHDKYPGEFYFDMKWAFGLDKIIRNNIELLKNNAINTFEELEYNVAKDYKILKSIRDQELYQKWFNGLTKRDKKLSEYLYSISFYPQKLDKNVIRNIFSMASPSPEKGEILESYNISDYSTDRNKIKIIYAFHANRSKNGIDIFGTSGFGELRPINDSHNPETIKVIEIQKEKNNNYFLGRKYIKYARLYENPKILKSFEKPIIIKNAVEWEANSNPLASFINKHEFPNELENQELLVYIKNQSLQEKFFPPVSTIVIFSKEIGNAELHSMPDLNLKSRVGLLTHHQKAGYALNATRHNNTKPVLTSVLWKFAPPETFPDIQKYLESLYQKYLSIKNAPNTPDKKEKIINIVSEIQWIFHRMIPYKRGSAAMGDALARILMESAGLKPTRWKIGVLPDLETFVSDLNSYKQSYTKLFESEPHF